MADAGAETGYENACSPIPTPGVLSPYPTCVCTGGGQEEEGQRTQTGPQTVSKAASRSQRPLQARMAALGARQAVTVLAKTRGQRSTKTGTRQN